MEFKEIQPDICKRNDTNENHESENQKCIEDIEFILFYQGLKHKKVLTDRKFPGDYQAIEKVIQYSDNDNENSANIYINSILGKTIRRWDYEIYLTGNEGFKRKIIGILEQFDPKNSFTKYKGTSIFPNS